MNDRNEPKYLTKSPDFYCPVGSIGLAWHWGLAYTECPLVPKERDMGICERCPLKNTRMMKTSDATDVKPKKRKKKKEIIPVIRKTYSTEGRVNYDDTKRRETE